jgi:beta propeller repeat protein
MKNRVLVGIMLIILLGTFIGVGVRPAGAAMVITEVQLTTNPAMQSEPDTYGGRIVWQDNRNGNWDIYMLSDAPPYIPETRITTSPANQEFPAINGNRIVYMDDRNGNWDIYLYDIGNQTETQITNNTADQFFPALDGNTIVWQDNRNDPEGIILNDNWEIYSYDLATQTETRRTFSSSGSSNQYPVIFGNRIVYVKTVPKWDTSLSVGLYEVFLDGTIEMCVEPTRDYPYTDLPHPSIFGNYWVYEWVYVDTTNNYRNRIKFWSHGFVSDEYQRASYPDMDDMYVVWQQFEPWTNWEIYLYRRDTATVTRVTNNGAYQLKPAVSEGRIVYQDNRNGNWDIYLSKVGYTASATPPPTSPVPGGSPPSGNGSLYVASYPSNATILINGTAAGMTDKFVTNVPSGTCNLTLMKDGYQPYTTMVTVPVGDVKALAPITLTKGSGPIPPGGTGTLYVASYPTNATILINGTAYGKTDQFIVNVPSGNQNLTLTKDGYQPYTTMVHVPVGAMKVLAPITLSPSQSVGDCPPPCITGGYLGECVCPIGN